MANSLNFGENYKIFDGHDSPASLSPRRDHFSSLLDQFCLMYTKKFGSFQMMRLLKIDIDHSILYRNTLIRLCFSYASLVVVYTVFGYYSFVISRREGMIAQYISYVIINGTFALMTIQFQVFIYSVYTRFHALNTFVE